MAMDADVGHVAPGRIIRRSARRCWDADSLDRHVGSKAAGEFHHAGVRVLAAVVDRGVGAELRGRAPGACRRGRWR